MHNDRNDNLVSYINYGEEDQMEISGYKKDNVKNITIWIMYVMTLGLLRLFFHWYPQLKLKATHKKCNLKEAEVVLIIDDYKGKYKSYFVKTVKTLSANLCTNSNKNSIKSSPDFCSKNMKLKSQRLSINLTGSRKELLEVKAFWCKKLCYIWDEDTKTFTKLVGLDNGITNEEFYHFNGLNVIDQFLRRVTYGYNEIDVPIQSILTLLIIEALTPFYMFQVFSLIVWLAENYYLYAIAIVIMSVVGIGSSIIQTRSNQKNLRGTVHSVDKITVVREENVYDYIPTTQLVPGDLIVIPMHGCTMHCDAVLLKGNCIVNESMLTGESVPVTKTPLPKTSDFYDSKNDMNHTLYCGTKIIQIRQYGGEKVLAVVTRTGFLTTKGQLVRSILYPPPADFKFDRDSYKFIGILSVIAFLGFLYTIVSKLSRQIQPLDILLKSLDVVTIAVPPALPAAMTVGKLYALNRLRKKKIFCINSRIINVSGSIDCVCFDKTGTLTEDGLDMWGVIPVEEDKLVVPIKNIQELPSDSLLLHGMASCHSITLIDGKLQGDPLDVKMFESTEWTLEEPSDKTMQDIPVLTVVKSQINNMEIELIHQFQFVSSLQRMSVITKTNESNYFQLFCKGSPEMIISLSVPESVPNDIQNKLKLYTEKGFRVIALSMKVLNIKYEEIQNLNRINVESKLTFLGLIIMENRVKIETVPVIRTLKAADMKIIMITGDNIQTAVSVAKECEIVSGNRNFVLLTVDPPTKTEDAHLVFTPLKSCTKMLEITKINIDNIHELDDFQYIMSGTTWSLLRQYFPSQIPEFARNGVVFARMNSLQKQQLVLELQNLGHYVAMCGDGANDCGALKAAHVGISLSEAEASVASPFTSQEPNISCVPEVVKEGRAALVTSFGVFKFMICYSLTQFTSIIILCGIDSYMSNAQFLFIDIFLALNFASVFGLTKAWDKYLSKQPPMSSLLNFIPIASITLQMIIVIIFQIISYYYIQTYDWFVPFVFKSGENYVTCYETFAVFSISMYQYIILAVVFSKGKPYRRKLYTNSIFILSILTTIILNSYITLIPADWIIKLMEFKMPPEINFGIMILTMAFIHLLTALFVEDVFVQYFLKKFILPLFQSNSKFVNCIKNSAVNECQFNNGNDPLNVTYSQNNGNVNKGFHDADSNDLKLSSIITKL